MLISTVTNSIMAALRLASTKLFLIKCENSWEQKKCWTAMFRMEIKLRLTTSKK